MKKIGLILLWAFLILGIVCAAFNSFSDQYIGGKKTPYNVIETVTCASNAGTASASFLTTNIVTDGGADTNEDTVSLVDGYPGQVKYFIYKTETDNGDTANVTPDSLAGGSKIVFDVPGEGCTMIFDGANWSIVANNGGAIS